MSFRRDDRISIIGALRPAAGQVVTRAVVTTYSLDLVALLGLVLTLGGDSEAEYETSPLGLVRAFDMMRGRLVVLHQLGRIVAPARHRSILPLLDTMVRAIPANERSESWHPKIALVRYEREGDAEWRFWIGSRNLTGSTDLDAGLLLCTSKSRSSKYYHGRRRTGGRPPPRSGPDIRGAIRNSRRQMGRSRWSHGQGTALASARRHPEVPARGALGAGGPRLRRQPLHRPSGTG
jgi:hypothetical protein